VKKITGHAKRKAGQVTGETAENVANATNEVIDTTLETGSSVINSTAAEGSNAARRRIGGAGKALTPSGQRGGESSDNLAIALASGRAVLRSMRFAGITDVLEPSARELAKRLADALKATPGTFLIEAHVDAMQSPTAAQELSEHRAAAVKAALIKHGVPVARLTALGYGATRPLPEVPADGGAPSSARIEVARTQ
jgi:OOP family OmpA-OmpF porin